MTARIPIPPELGAHFSVTEAAAAGVGRGRLAGPDLRAEFRGTRSMRDRGDGLRDSVEAAVLDRARAYAPRLAADQRFCATTAIVIFGCAVPESLRSMPIQVSTPINRARPSIPGVRSHRYSGSGHRVVDGLPVCAPGLAWAQSAEVLDLDSMIVAGDSLLRRVRPVCTIDELAAVVRRWNGRRGSVNLRRAFEAVRARTDAPSETRARLLVVRAGLPEPVVNVPIRDEHGRLIAYGDLGYPEWRILIEYDGEYHFASAAQARRDLDRVAALQRLGWIVLRIHAGTLASPDQFLSDLARAIRSRSA